MPERLRFGVLGAAWIADRALIPAMQAARHALPLAVASRDPERARKLAARHGLPRVHPTYEALLEDAELDAVYVALHNSAHREWAERALQAGKHVLCEKPLALDAREAEAMFAVAEQSRRSLMEAFMYRFHPRMRALQESAASVRFLHAAFAFPLASADNYRWHPELGGGALLDVGCYTLDVARWFLGEPESVQAAWRAGVVDTAVAALLGFPGGEMASTWASFEGPEHQSLLLLGGEGTQRVAQPFTAWRDPHDPYQLMVDAFAQSVIDGAVPPRPPQESLGTLRLLDRVRQVASRPSPREERA